MTGLVLTWLGVNDAAAYGVIAGLMNFIPIVGALVTTGIVAAVASPSMASRRPS